MAPTPTHTYRQVRKLRVCSASTSDAIQQHGNYHPLPFRSGPINFGAVAKNLGAIQCAPVLAECKVNLRDDD